MISNNNNNCENKKGSSVVGEIKVSDEILTFGKVEKLDNTDIKLAHPMARKLINDNKLDINLIKPKDGEIIMVTDVQDYLNQNSFLQQFKNLDIETKPMSPVQKAMMKKMSESKQMIPHATMFIDLEINKLWEHRKTLKNELASENIPVTFLTLMLKAMTIVLAKNPIFNSSVSPDYKIVYKKQINLGFAIDSPKGLIVLVIKNANDLSLKQIAIKQKELIEKAQKGIITRDMIGDSTFTITNFGSLGAKYGTPIINYPESAILGMGLIFKKPTWDENNQLSFDYILPLSLAFDHRHLAGGDASRFVKDLVETLKDHKNFII
ncbi:MAG: 2-oxo acid dehydrogenase subunit E2 [Mycoplasma sp.]|nr:2-oxo acid dehydrogenase subunit E2 [Mycoplasma sp.]